MIDTCAQAGGREFQKGEQATGFWQVQLSQCISANNLLPQKFWGKESHSNPFKSFLLPSHWPLTSGSVTQRLSVPSSELLSFVLLLAPEKGGQSGWSYRDPSSKGQLHPGLLSSWPAFTVGKANANLALGVPRECLERFDVYPASLLPSLLISTVASSVTEGGK